MQIISKNGVVKCRTAVHYAPEIVQQMKRAGYKVKEVADDAENKAALLQVRGSHTELPCSVREIQGL